MALQNYAIEPMKTFLDGQYSIPNYQREYSWEENEIQDFLNDLEDTCANPSTIHFFGQIVVHNDEDSQTKFIIDGQQRTITSMIFCTLFSFCTKIYILPLNIILHQKRKFYCPIM